LCVPIGRPHCTHSPFFRGSLYVMMREPNPK
jgi:hypothetical protein